MEEYLNIVNALRNSSRLSHWDKPPRDYGPNNPEDSDYNRNGLKDVGDFSRIYISSQSSFRPEPDEAYECPASDEDKEEESVDILHHRHTKPADNTSDVIISHTRIFYSMEASIGLEPASRPSSLEIARKAQEQYGLNLLLERMSLEKNYKLAVQKKARQRHEAYIKHLNQIHSMHDEEIEKNRLIQEEKLKLEENRLKQQQVDALTAVQHCKNEYNNHVSRHSSQLLEAVESARRQEAEQASLIQSLVTQLQTSHAAFIAKQDNMYEAFRELEGTETLDSATEAFLGETRSQVEAIIYSFHQNVPTQKQIGDAKNLLQQGLVCIDSVLHKVEAKKLEKVNLEAERLKQENENAKLQAAAQLEMEKQKSLSKQENKTEQKKEDKVDIITEAEKKDSLLELKQKVGHFLEAHEKLSKEKLWELRRRATTANQLSTDDHNINRDKLQKLLTDLREKKSEPDILACFKHLITSNIVKQVVIQDTLGASAYSWLFVELVTYHPDMWDLFLYYTFKACPSLMPGSQIIKESQKTSEKPDVYYSQVGKHAMMYGLVLARISKKQGSPVQAASIGWEVLASIISKPPTSGVTGEVLLKFLQSFGYALQQTYGKQFIKLMGYIEKCYVEKIKEGMEEGGQNCLTLLQNFITEYKISKLKQNPLLNKYM